MYRGRGDCEPGQERLSPSHERVAPPQRMPPPKRIHRTADDERWAPEPLLDWSAGVLRDRPSNRYPHDHPRDGQTHQRNAMQVGFLQSDRPLADSGRTVFRGAMAAFGAPSCHPLRGITEIAPDRLQHVADGHCVYIPVSGCHPLSRIAPVRVWTGMGAKREPIEGRTDKSFALVDNKHGTAERRVHSLRAQRKATAV